MATETRRLNISIALQLSRLIRKKIRSGRYANASEVVRDALRRLEQEDLLAKQTAIVKNPAQGQAVRRDIVSAVIWTRSGITQPLPAVSYRCASVSIRGKKKGLVNSKTEGHGWTPIHTDKNSLNRQFAAIHHLFEIEFGFHRN